MNGDYSPHEAIQFVWDNAPKLAVAKGKLAQLEAFRHSLKAILMTKSTETSFAGREMEALSSIEMQNHCKALGEATENFEKLKWQMETAKMRFEAWRTEQATKRYFDKIA